MEKSDKAKFRYRPFGNRAREVAPDHRYYWVYSLAGPDPTGIRSPLLGIVRRGPDGKWSADLLTGARAPKGQFRTRDRAARSLVLVDA